MSYEFIEVSAEVRYWEDASVNGVDDDSGSLIPFRNGDLWCPVIRLSDGAVVDWPAGMTASIHYKVCDQGEYWLLDSERKRVAKWGGDYVPDDFLCHGDRGYGDYIIFKVGADGVIAKWRAPEVEMARDSDDDDAQSLWVPIVPTRDADAEIAELRRDAERYRWLRDQGGREIDTPWVVFRGGAWFLRSEFDAAIDAARSEGGGGE